MTGNVVTENENKKINLNLRESINVKGLHIGSGKNLDNGLRLGMSILELLNILK